MATESTLEQRLANRLKDVPGVTPDDVAGWLAEAQAELNDPAASDNTVLYLALSLAFEVIATNAARFFSFTDGEESIDKSMIFEKYIALADRARRQFRRCLNGGFGASQSHPSRADNR